MMCIFLRCRRPHRPVDTVREGLRKSSIMCATDPDQWRSTFDNLPSSCFFEELSLGLDALLGGTLQYSDLRHRQKLNRGGRSEEHTSELQSPDHLVCRLLLEKKKTYKRLYRY